MTTEELNNLEEPLDYEIADLVKLLNQVEGITTTSSCFGHNEEPITIYGVADSIEVLNKFRYKYLYCNSMWHIELILSDKTVDNKEWWKIEFVLKTSDLYYSYPITQLLADNLTMKLKDVTDEDNESEDTYELLRQNERII